jgi:hypothetical protein
VKTLHEHRHKLEDFQGFAKALGVSEISEISASTLAAYRNEQISRIACSWTRKLGALKL